MGAEATEGRTTLPEASLVPAPVPAALASPGAPRFWLLAALTGVGAGVAGAALTLLLKAVQDFAWSAAPGTTQLDAATPTGPLHRLGLLVLAGALTGLGQILLTRLASGNGIDLRERDPHADVAATG